MPKLTLIGAGSSKFVRELAVDFFSIERLRGLHFCLMDIDAARAARSRRLLQKIIDDRKLPATVEATTDQRRALAGADYVIITIMVGGFDRYHADVAIPAKYGILQTVSDTIGPGGVMRTLRTAPVMRSIAHDLAEVAPRAWVLNYANPMAMNVWSLLDSGHQRSVGLCHSIQYARMHIAHWLGIKWQDIVYRAGGINHVDFYLQLELNGEDLYPRLREAGPRIVKEHPDERVRFELLEHLGHFPAEGPAHQLEYYGYFHKNEQLAKHYAVGAYWGYNVDFQHFQTRAAEIEDQIAGRKPITDEPSVEYGAHIIHALEGGPAFPFYGNVRNQGLIENLPPQAVVEVPCMADRNGIVPGRVGRVPPQLAAVMSPHVAVHELAVTGVLTRNRRMLYHAIAADPLTHAVLTLPQIRQLTDELLADNSAYLAGW